MMLYLDEIVKQLMPPDSNPELVPVTVIGDGNWLFWSISLVLFGDKDHHCELGVRSSMELACYVHAYMKQDTIDNMAEYSYNKSVEYILQVSISDDAFGTDMERSLKAEVKLGAKMEEIPQYFSYWQPVTFVKGNKQYIPKSTDSWCNRRVHNQIFFRGGQTYYPENLDGIINILWMHTSDTNLQGWKPNHIVPFFPKNTTLRRHRAYVWRR